MGLSRGVLLIGALLGLSACQAQDPGGSGERLESLRKEVIQLRADLNEAQARIEELEKATGLASGADAREDAPPDEGQGPDLVASHGLGAGPPEARLEVSPLPPKVPVVALSEREPSRRRAWKWTRLSRSQVAETVRDHALAVHACIAPILNPSAEPSRSVDLRFRILRSGKVEDVRVSARAGDQAACFQEAFGAMRFPQFSGKTMSVGRLPLSLAWQPADPESALILEDEIELSQGR